MAKYTDEQKKKLRQQFDTARNQSILQSNVQNTSSTIANGTDNSTMMQRVQARYEENMRQAKSITDNTYKISNSQKTNNNKIIKYSENKDVVKGRVRNKEKGLLKDAKNIVSNFGLGIKKAGESGMYYMESMSNNFSGYKRYNQFNSNLNQEKEKQENLKSGKTLEGKKATSKMLPSLDNLKQQKLINQSTNPMLSKIKENQSLESPINQTINKKITVDEEKIQQNIENSSNVVSKKIAELTPSIAQSVTGMAVSAVNPGLGLAFWQTSAGGDYIRDAKARGMNDNDALVYGTVMGAMESVTEKIGAELTAGIGKAFSSKGAIKGLKALGLDIGENFFEEAITEPIQETVATMTGGKETADWSNMLKRMLQSGIDGALTSIIMGGASAGIGKATNLIGKMQEGKTVSQEEIADTLKEINKQEEIDIEKVLASTFGISAKNNNVQIKNQNGKVSNLFVDENSSLNELTRKANTNELLDQRMNKVAEDMKSKSDINYIIQNSNLAEEQKASLKRVAEKHNMTTEEVQNLINNPPINKQKTIENNIKINYNNTKLGEVKNIPTKDLIPLYNGGSYRTNEQISSLRENIKQNGITEPIEIYKKSDGTYGIENGNHRLQIANELGIENIPVKLVESWENVLSKDNNVNINLDIEEEFYANKTSKRNSDIDGKSWSSTGSMSKVNELSRNRGTAEGNVGIFKGTSNSNEQTSNVQNKGNNREIENSDERYDIDRGVIKKVTNARLQLPRLSNYEENTMAKQQLLRNSDSSVDTVNNVSTSNNIIPQNEKNMQVQNEKLATANEDLKVKIPGSNYKFEASGNQKVDNLRQDANKYFNNSEKAKNYVGMLEKIITDKNIDIRLDANLKTSDGKIANGSYSNGVITINPNSTKAGEFIAVHELTHAIGTKDMLNIVENYRKSNSEFDTAIQSLLENYKTTEITEEALADVSAQLFGNQEFINNVSQNNPNIFQKIYSEIKYLWHQFRGYKNQDQFIEDLYYKWTKAYNSSNELNSTTNYSTETLEDGTTYVKAENNKFIKEDGTKMTPREAYQSLIGTTIQFSDGDSAKIVNRLPNKDMYNELSKRYPSKFKNVENIKEVNGSINDNIEELLTNTTIKEANVPDFKDRHQKQGIKNFDTRTVKFYDGNNAYDIDFSIAVLEDGSKVAYAKKYIEGNQNLTQKIKTVEARSEKSSLNQQSLSKDSIAPSNNDVNTSTKYSIQESENNSGSFNLSKQDNKGRTLSQEQQEYFKDSKVRDENGNLKTVYHTTTKAGEQFNIFDPRGTDFYRFGDQIVNYYTDSKVMSGSYADGKYQMADTNKKNNNNNIAKRQYEGYVNLINPYILDAKNANWNQIGEGLTEYGQKLWKEIDTLEKNDLYYELKRLYDKVSFDSKNASERFREIQKNAEDGQYVILGEYARFGNIDNIFDNGLLNDRGKEQVKKHLNDKINGRTLKEIGLDLYNNKYDTLWENRINEFKNKNPIIKDFSIEDLDLIAENYSGGKSYIEYRYLNKKTTNDIVNKVIEMNKEGSNYDGVIIKNVIDYGGGNTETRDPANLYVTFNSNQFKNVDNTNPTDNPDIRYSTQTNNSWHDYLEKTFPNKGTRTNLQDILVQKADNEGSYSTKNNVANSQETVYNNVESDGGLNEQGINRGESNQTDVGSQKENDFSERYEQFNRTTQTGDLERNSDESKLFEKRKQIAEKQYREWEKSITPKTESEITNKERTLKDKFKKTQNKDIVFIKKDNGNGYNAGASLDKPNVIYINAEQSEKFGLDRTAYHETMESNIRFADELKKDIVISSINDVLDMDIFEKQKQEFWSNQEGDCPSDTAIAKDIICDRFAELNGEKIDYKIYDEIKDRIDLSIEYFENQNAQNEGSFLLPQNPVKLPKQAQTNNKRHVFRNDKVNANFNAENKPQGLYVSDLYDKDINDFTKPHKDEVHNMDYEFYIEPKNPLILKSRDAEIERAGEIVSADTGVQALKELKGNEQFEKLKKMSFSELKLYAEDIFPQYDWTNSTDKGDILSGLGASFAREYEYDSIIPPRSEFRDNEWLAGVEDIENEMVILKNELLENLEGKTNKNNVANNQETLYNGVESESDINGRFNQRNDGTSRLFEESTEKQREYSWDEYNKWEESIKPTENITNKEQQSINKSKSEHNKDVFLYDENNNDNTYSGGASRNVKNKINISRQQAEYFGLDFMIDHETIESDILQNQELYEDIVKPVIEKIQKDSNFKEQVDEFWRNEEGNKPSDRLIAKDIFCDRFAQMRGNELKYKNILSQETNMNIDYALNNFYKEIYGKEIESSNESSFLLPQNPAKMRKHYDSIIKSKFTSSEAKAIAKEMMGTDTYVPETNEGQLQQADERIKSSSPQAELSSLMGRSMTGGKIDSIDIAVGERLIQYYSKTGDSKNLRDAIHATALAGTSAGQTVQAMSLLNHQTPEGQAIWIERSIEKINKELAKLKGGTIQTDENGIVKVVDKRGKDITDKVPTYKLTDEMLSTITNSTKENLVENLDKVYEELGQQVPKTLAEKIDSWRYFSMLANVKTHHRNIIGNLTMGKTQGFKNKLSGIIEGVVSKVNPEMERTHTVVPSSKEVKQFAKNDIKNVEDRLGLNDNKYNPKTRLKNNQRTFKSDIAESTLGTAFNLNDKALEAEDGWGLKACYWKSLAEYMTANKLTPENITDAQLGKARNYAVNEAKEATFHQENAVASAINQFAKKNKATKFITDAVLPFVKTPMNVAYTAIEYSPIGLGKTLVKNSIDLRKGNITVNKYIDNISKGLTGSGITFLGYVLADAGILKASGDDDDKLSEFESDQGKQSYSIQIGDNTYSLDWLAPVGIPLFIGAELHALKNAKLQEKSSVSNDDNTMINQVGKSAGNLFNALATAMNPMSEMSMLSGLASTLSSYEENKLAGIMTNMSKSYVNQFVPTALGQVAKVTDDYERSTTSTKTGLVSKTIDQTVNQFKSKIPGLRQSLPVKTDVWGDEQKTNENVAIRAFETFIAPYTRKDIKDTALNKALSKLYKDTGEGSVLPSSIEKDLTIDKQKYRYTDKEYANAKKEYGKNAKSILTELTTSNSYNKMSDTEKVTAISDVYSYVKESLKKNYADSNRLELKTSTLYDTVTELKDKKANISSFFQYNAQTKEMEKDTEKVKYLSELNTDSKTKDIIYRNRLMSKAEEGKTTEYEELKEYYANNSVLGSKNYRSYDIVNQYLDYKVNADNKIKELRANGTKKENENLTEVERIQVLKDSGYTNAQTEALYSTVVAEERGHKIYEELKKLNDGNSIQSYMTFMLSDRESEKEDDGTLSGKSINGSKLHKVQNTLKGMGQLNTISKIYLEATQASIKKYASKDYAMLRSYLDETTEKEQTIIMETIQGTTKMKNGKYKY